jgi:hypothetical protein
LIALIVVSLPNHPVAPEIKTLIGVILLIIH